MDTDQTRVRQNRAAELQRSIVTIDGDIRKGREKLQALKRAHASSGTGTAPKGTILRPKGTKLPTEVCQLMCELRDTLKKSMRETATLKKEKVRLGGLVSKTAKAEEKTVRDVESAQVQYVPSAHFMKYDPSVVAQQRLFHSKKELGSVHTVIDQQMKAMARAFDTAARKCELDKQLMFLSQEVQEKKTALQSVVEECQSINRIYRRKKLFLARAPKPLDPMQVLQLDMQKEVAYDALSKQETAAVAAKESIAYRANLLCQLERNLKVKAEAVQYILDQMNANDAAAAAAISGRENESQESAAAAGAGAGEDDATNSRAGSAPAATAVRASTLASLRDEIASLNKQDSALDKKLEEVDDAVSDLEYRAKVMHKATESLEKERGRLLRQHDRQIAQLHQSAEEQARMAKALIDEERSRSVSQMA